MQLETRQIDYDLLDALQRLNWNYGRGDIRAYRLEGNGGIAYRRIPVTQKTGHLEERRFRIVGNTVHFLGHQRRVNA